ncbi:MAG TPA: polysaccharide deacetylase family protein [Gaiellaceae bacterium]|nr:polysaccharide deacetylase family protein [Gaiellaceae bacterium]
MLRYWLPATAIVSARARRHYGVEATVDSGVALTFDDGPHPEGTPAVLEALGDTVATFFLVGEQVERRPELVARIVASGHEIGVHCHRHCNLLRIGPRAVHDDLERAAKLIADAAGREPTLYRPPYGILNATALAEARARGWRTLLWSRWGKDWRRRATAASIERSVGPLRSGDVVLLHDADYYSAHDSWRRTVAAVPRVIEKLHKSGFEARLP